MELADFLHARLAEDAARQQDIWEQWHHKGCEAVPQVLYPDRETGTCDCGVPARILADIEAKQQVVVNLAAVQLEQPTLRELRGPLAEVTLRMLAQPYRQHPDFDPVWLEN